MRRVSFFLVVVMLAATAPAQTVKPDDSKKYKDTLNELKAAQDRKAELATQNEKLAARVAELEKQLQAQSVQLDEMKRQALAFADQTFFLRSHYEAWKHFIAANRAVKMQWEIFVQAVASLNASPQPAIFMDPQWPLSVEQ